VTDRPLAGKAALVTGGSQGLGLGMAEALAAAGADVAIVARRADRLERAARLLATHGGRVETLSADLADLDQAVGAVDDAARRLGALDIFVSAAAAQLRKPVLEVTPADWEQIVAVNLRAVYFMAQRSAQRMLERDRGERGCGKIVNVASLTAVGAWPAVSVYGMTKGGVVQLTKAMALELGSLGICVNAIGPGTFRTELTESIYADPERAAQVVQRIPLGRPGTPADLAGAVVFLASPASDYVTGQTLWVDGGWLTT
jgi:NAD(P)-dependent dehydrogenase (short-subunit alcohol dehydrogenase family)